MEEGEVIEVALHTDTPVGYNGDRPVFGLQTTGISIFRWYSLGTTHKLTRAISRENLGAKEAEAECKFLSWHRVSELLVTELRNLVYFRTLDHPRT